MHHLFLSDVAMSRVGKTSEHQQLYKVKTEKVDDHNYGKAARSAQHDRRRSMAENQPKMETDEKSSDASSTASGSGGPYTPVELAKPVYNRKIRHESIQYSGTTFIGPAKVDANENVWYQFPWEYTQAAISSWRRNKLLDQYLVWKATDIRVKFMNPLCIQDIGEATGGLASAGQNLHAQLYAYQDNCYMTGISHQWPTTTIDEANSLIASWRKQGYNDDGLPIRLPELQLSTAQFQYYYPDVKQCTMGPGNEMSYHWNINNSHWRSTMQLDNRPQATDTNLHDYVRWDEYLGATMVLDPGSVDVDARGELIDFITPQSDKRQSSLFTTWSTNREVGGLNGTTNVTGPNPFILQTNSDPIPKLWLQLQPQLGAIATGLSDAVCQLQFQVEIDLEFSMICPSILTDVSSMTGITETRKQKYGSEWVNFNGIPMWIPIARRFTKATSLYVNKCKKDDNKAKKRQLKDRMVAYAKEEQAIAAMKKDLGEDSE